MEQVRKSLELRENYLCQLKKEKEKSLEHAPEGLLRISNRGNRTQYFVKSNSRECSGKYIKDKQIARDLAQRDYDKKILRTVEKEIKVIQKYLSDYPQVAAESVYEKLHKERQKLVHPIEDTDEEFIRNWEKVEYQGKGFEDDAAEYYTAKGERVRSKSEVIIADLLNRLKIPYRYEYPLRLGKWGILYPDFTILNINQRKEIIWEHFGMMDHEAYAEKALMKIRTYEENGVFPGENLILTYETMKSPLNQKQILNVIRHYLGKRKD